MNVKEYNSEALIKELAVELEKVPDCKIPDWAKLVKTGVGKTRPPMKQDWWYQRSASILRRIALNGPIGVNKLKRKYGCKYRRGYKPAVFSEGSGKIIRVILQQLEKAGYIKQNVVSGHKGRVIDSKGIELVSMVAKNIRVTEE